MTTQKQEKQGQENLDFLYAILSHATTLNKQIYCLNTILKNLFKYENYKNHTLWPEIESLNDKIFVERHGKIFEIMKFGGENSCCFRLLEYILTDDGSQVNGSKGLKNGFKNLELYYETTSHFIRSILANSMAHWKQNPRHLVEHRKNNKIDQNYLKISQKIIELACHESNNFAPNCLLLWSEKLEFLDSFEIYLVLCCVYRVVLD